MRRVLGRAVRWMRRRRRAHARWGPLPRACAAGALIASGVPAATSAQMARGNVPAPPAIAGVAIERQSVFDSAETTRWYARLANRLHVTTRQHVVERELLFRQGEPLDSARLAETERNLRALRIFRNVSVGSVAGDSGMDVRVVTRDAWTTKLSVKVGVTGDQYMLGASATESNLFGRGLEFGFAYRSDPDRINNQLWFKAPRVIAGRARVAAGINLMSDGERGMAELVLPFFSLRSRRAGGVSGELSDGQVLRFRDGSPDPSERLRRVFAVARANVGRAVRTSDDGYLRLILDGQIRRDDFVADSAAETIPRTVTGAFQLTADARRARYITTRYFLGNGGPEDVDLSDGAQVALSLAPQAFGYEQGGVGSVLAAGVGKSFRGGFAQLRARANGLFAGGGLDSGSVAASGMAVLQPAPRHVAVLHLWGAQRDDPYPGQEYDLGLARGPRAFAAHAFTGDRAYFGMAEYRWVALPDVMGLASLGVAGFVERGGAWFSGSPRRGGTDAGVGIRLGSIRASSGRPATRIDVAWRFPNDAEPGAWVLVLGSGYPFQNLW